jgi:hypothetical protein
LHLLVKGIFLFDESRSHQADPLDIVPASGIRSGFVAQLFAALGEFFLAMWIVELNIKFFMGATFVAAGTLLRPPPMRGLRFCYLSYSFLEQVAASP